ncbi:alpha/beta fold hydrolase [Micromonospora sp. DT233]|uniref:alpha/beta fold hydrolase n=1 Tax=Micromonospora sp. DT233 TaxID=3393432 RepID=UPI003CF0CF52
MTAVVHPPDPHQLIQAVVSAQWYSVMGRPPLDVDEDFFATGASVIDAATYASQLSDAFGREVSVQLVYENPTVRSLCSAIRSGSAGLRSRILPLCLDGDGAPLLFIPGAHGNPAVNDRLTEPIFGRRVYGLEFRGLLPGDGEPLRSLEEVVEDITHEIGQWRTAEPVHLAGYCTGAVYAMEVARELIGIGWPVRSVTMLSPSTQPQGPYQPDFDELLTDRVAHIAASEGLADYSGPPVASALFAELRAGGKEVAEEYVEEVIARARMFVSNFYALTRYKPPPTPVGTPVTVLLPQGEDGDLALSYWPDVLAPTTTFETFGCDHLDVPGNPAVMAAMAKAMHAADREAEDADTAGSHNRREAAAPAPPPS